MKSIEDHIEYDKKIADDPQGILHKKTCKRRVA